MPRRETQDDEQKVILAFGSVNERQTDVELPDNEFSFIAGTFPDYLGEQGRIFGKRTLAKYADPIYGIHQFWMPYGYGLGLYQFTGTLEGGPWRVPWSKFPDLTLPPEIPFDGGGYTVDEFGDSWGRIVDIGNPNVCVISFEELRTLHISCGLSPTPSDTPDDANGGPGGQGSRCRWVEQVDTYLLNALIATKQKAVYTYETIISEGDIGGPCGPLPIPTPVPVGPYVAPSSFLNVSLGTSFEAAGSNSSGITYGPSQTPGCGQHYTAGQSQTNSPQATRTEKGTLDLTALQPTYKNYSGVRTVIEISVYNPSSAPPVSIEHDLGVTWGDLSGNFASVQINMQDYLPAPTPTNNGFQGQDASSEVLTGNLKVYWNKRVCTPN